MPRTAEATRLSKQSDHFVQRPNMIAHTRFYRSTLRTQSSGLFELAGWFVRFDHVARFIDSAKHRVM